MRCPYVAGPVSSFLCENAHSSRSLLRSIRRMIWRPHVCWASRAVNRSCDSGIRSSAVHPNESMRVASSHTGSQEGSRLLPPSPSASPNTPAGLTSNTARVR